MPCALGKKSATSTPRAPASFCRVSTVGLLLPVSMWTSVTRSIPASAAVRSWLQPCPFLIRLTACIAPLGSLLLLEIYHNLLAILNKQGQWAR
jgi:hypothetical protein